MGNLSPKCGRLELQNGSLSTPVGHMVSWLQEIQLVKRTKPEPFKLGELLLVVLTGAWLVPCLRATQSDGV